MVRRSSRQTDAALPVAEPAEEPAEVCVFIGRTWFMPQDLAVITAGGKLVTAAITERENLPQNKVEGCEGEVVPDPDDYIRLADGGKLCVRLHVVEDVPHCDL